VVNGLLRRDLYFRGLIFTDGLGMEGVNKHFKPGESDVEALVAGNDVLLLPVNLDSTFIAVKRALNSGYLPQKQFETSVLRVLRAKYRLDLTKAQQVKTENLRNEINTGKALALKYKIFANATVLLRDLPGLIGMENTEQLRIATLSIGDSSRTVFQTYCNYYAPMVHFNTPKKISPKQSDFLADTLKSYDVILLSFHGTRSKAVDSFGMDWTQRALVSRLNMTTNLMTTYFGNPYALKHLDTLPVLLLAHTEDPLAQQVAAQNIFGALDIKGKLPVTISESLSYLHGVDREFFRKRLAYAPPESVGMNSDTLRLMDDLARDIIANGAAPGCQMLVVKDNRVVWNKAYGNYTYEPNAPAVSTETIYDLASITKVAATTLSLMQLKEKGQIALDENMSKYIPELQKTDKNKLKVREILAHHAGLEAWIPFYQQTLTAQKMPDSILYQRADSTGAFLPVAKDFYLRSDYSDTIWNKIFTSKLNPEKGYKYSDLGFYLGARAVQNISNQSVDEYAKENFYIPMGMTTMRYNPWKSDLESRCAPTEEDGYFRRQRLQGYVHDMGAAMLGGVSGHAGLFSNANDLAKIFQMLLNGGVYGNREYLDKKTVQEFTTRFAGSTRRGIGFDMKETNASQTQNMSPLAGPNTFGHMGFTGNSVWADPDSKLIVIFLSNRTYPTMENNKLINGDYRPKMQSIAYRAMNKK
jgi:CubicO group peptidase (beta-lactamase class C family)